MPTTYTDQFYLMDPANPPAVGTTLNVSSLSFTDENDNGLVNRFSSDSVDGSDITASWPGDTITVNVPGVGDVTYTGITFYLADGRRVFTPTDGSVLQDGTLVSTTFVNTQGSLDVDDLGPVCFADGTLIETDRGEVAVEDIGVGDLIRTRDSGFQPVRWMGSRRLSSEELGANPDLRPIRIKANALADGVPASDLIVSPQHRILVRSKIAQRMFGAEEILVAAKHLCQVEGVETAADLAEVVYYHILFDRHEVVKSNGAETESLFTGPVALRSLSREALNEVFTLFPELLDRNRSSRPARELVPGRLGRKLAWRHAQNRKPLVA